MSLYIRYFTYLLPRYCKHITQTCASISTKWIYSLTEMSIGEQQKFAIFFCGHKMKKEWRNLFKGYCWHPNSETVNPAKLRKHQWGTTLIPVHAKRNWCHVQSSNLFFKGKHIERFQCKGKCFSELMSRKLERLKLCLEMDLITSCWPGLCIWQLKKDFLVTTWWLH